ncbi:hypothetical protein COCOBI_10-0480 [Coccomyxa sp. Obi]|nr:hypothetical protein COCOBI_10-0480 [Coccomyxa sp. Obi]
MGSNESQSGCSAALSDKIAKMRKQLQLAASSLIKNNDDLERELVEVRSERDAAKQEVEALRKYNRNSARQLSSAVMNAANLEERLARKEAELGARQTIEDSIAGAKSDLISERVMMGEEHSAAVQHVERSWQGRLNRLRAHLEAVLARNLQAAEDRANGLVDRAAKTQQASRETKDSLSRLLWDHAQLGHKLARVEAERDAAKREAQAAWQREIIARAGCKEQQQLLEAEVKETAEQARRYQAAVICEQELSKRAMAAKNRAEEALAEEHRATMAARASRAAAECKLETVKQTIFGLQSQLAEAVLRSTVADAGTSAPEGPSTLQVPKEAAGGGNALPQEPEQAPGKDVSQQEPNKSAADVVADVAAAQAGVQTRSKRPAEVPAQHDSSAKRTATTRLALTGPLTRTRKSEEFATPWEGEGHDVVVEFASNRQLCPAEFLTCMEPDGHDVVVQDASPVFLKSLLSAS